MDSKICLVKPKSAAGGSYTFTLNFQAWLTARGIPWTDDINADYDVLFVNSWTIPYVKVWRAKKRLSHLRVVQRIDGAAQDYGRKDGADWLQRDVNTLADLAIFQSQYSYDATVTRYGLIQTPGPIIYNPVDIAHFIPQGERLADLPIDKPRLISVAWSPNKLKGSWRIPLLARANPDLTFIFVGQSPFLSDPPPNVIHLGKMNRDELARALRSADIFLNLSENDPCPNIVLEAMACGLPVLFVPSGGVPELVGDSAGLPFTDDAMFAPTLQKLLAERSSYGAAARAAAAQRHAPDLIFERYLAAIAGATRRPLPPRLATLRGLIDYAVFDLREQRRKWGRILSGKQALRNPNR